MTLAPIPGLGAALSRRERECPPDLDGGDLYFDIHVNGIRWRGEWEPSDTGGVARVNVDLNAAEWTREEDSLCAWRRFIDDSLCSAEWNYVQRGLATIASLDAEPCDGDAIPKTAAAVFAAIDEDAILDTVKMYVREGWL